MEVGDVLKKAWAAVQESGVPEHLQADAFNRAVDLYKDGESGGEAGGASGSSGNKTKRTSTSQTAKAPKIENADLPDDDGFFSALASESGVTEEQLRDVFLYQDGVVTVTPPTRKLGPALNSQAKVVTILVASARAKGMGESPVDAEAVRAELKRKQCWDSSNFSAKVLGKLKGLNAGSNRNEMVVTSKWVGEFEDAVKTALGETDE